MTTYKRIRDLMQTRYGYERKIYIILFLYHCFRELILYTIYIITAHIRSMAEGNVFTGLCLPLPLPSMYHWSHDQRVGL